MTAMAGVVVIGAGHAGTTCAIATREAGYGRPVTLIGADPDGTYERPPLSKSFLKGTVTDAEINQRKESELALRGVDYLVGNRVERIERHRNMVLLADGRELSYEHLVLATGGTPWLPPIPGVEADGVLTLRTLDDALLIREYLRGARNLVVLGGGFIGLEVAAVARTNGVAVDIVEIGQRLLGRSTSPHMARYLYDIHASNGVTVHLDTVVRTIVADEGGLVCQVVTSDGKSLTADVVVVGAGVRPDDHLAEQAGLPVEDGVLVDGVLRTSDPRISAIGDVARFAAGDRTVRLESVQNAVDQGRYVARRIVLGDQSPYVSTPWFWSEQYSERLQIAGLRGAAEDFHVVPKPDASGFSVYGFADEVLTVVESVNSAADHIRARRVLGSRRTTANELRACAFDLRELLRT